MDLNLLRGKIDEIDDKILSLFTGRMEIAKEVAEYKAANGLPIHNSAREREILDRLISGVDTELAEYVKTLYNTIFEVSRNYQKEQNLTN